MTQPNGVFSVLDEATIQANWLRTYRNGFLQYGLPVPNTLPGSEPWIRARAYARGLTVSQSNGAVSVNNQMPDSAEGDYLLRWLSLLGLGVRPAGGSAGNVTLNNTQPSVVQLGATLIDPAGLVFAVAKGGTYAVGAQVPVVSLSGGTATNHANGDVLKWVIPPPYCGASVLVGLPGALDGLVGGVDAEDPENARNRLVLRLQNPMGGGNWTFFAVLGAGATPVVQAVFVYPAANGPGTVHVAVVGYASTLAASNARNRDVAASVMNSTVIPFITGFAFEGAEVIVTTVTNQPVDVSVAVSIPSAPAATPPGPGGGWLDGTPWPNNSASATNFKCSVTAVASTTQFTCDAPTAPIPGVSRVAWLDCETWELETATVVAYTGTSGAYVVEIDTPWPNLPDHDPSAPNYAALGVAYVFPQSVNQEAYVDALLGAFAGMGPGEKTSAAGLLPRASRKPLPTSQFPYVLGSSQLQALTNSDPVVVSSTWLYQSATTPTLPASISLPPSCLVPRSLAIYPAVTT